VAQATEGGARVKWLLWTPDGWEPVVPRRIDRCPHCGDEAGFKWYTFLTSGSWFCDGAVHPWCATWNINPRLNNMLVCENCHEASS
jgi:hypothetical protein